MVYFAVHVYTICGYTVVYTSKTLVVSYLATVDFLLIFMYKKVRKKITLKNSNMKKELNLHCLDCNNSLQDCTCIEDTINMTQTTLEKVKKQELESLFVGYDQAIALKELGFDEPCVCLYDEDVYLFSVREQDDIYDYWTPAPTYSQAFRWFREKYGYLSYIDMDNYSFYRYTIYKGKGISEAPFHTYEEAELKCLKKLIQIVKHGK